MITGIFRPFRASSRGRTMSTATRSVFPSLSPSSRVSTQTDSRIALSYEYTGLLSRGALCAAAGVRSVAIRAAVAAVASVLQVLKRMTRARIGMAGRYPGQLLGERGALGVRGAERVPRGGET